MKKNKIKKIIFQKNIFSLLNILVILIILLIFFIVFLFFKFIPEKTTDNLKEFEKDCSDIFIIPEEYKDYFENSGIKCFDEGVYIPKNEKSLILDDSGNLNIITKDEIVVIPLRSGE
jgi:hypothetical protein